MKSLLNLDFYKGEDLYTDGDIENDLLNLVKTNDNYDDIIKSDSRWPILYHLTPIRRNLLEWYSFDKTKTLLEIGAGCGALTGLFCEKTKQVTAIELSKRRAEIIEARYKKNDNLNIIVGNFEDIKLSEKYDYVTLIGVMEYAGSFISAENPYLEFLKQVRSLLKPEGILLLAIENQFGLKYFAGAMEDHLSIPFIGLEGYPNNSSCRTFGLPALKKLLKESGFTQTEFYYPYPDYKLPEAVYAEGSHPALPDIHQATPSYDQENLTLFNEQLVMSELISNDMFPFFSNSFLVHCQ